MLSNLLRPLNVILAEGFSKLTPSPTGKVGHIGALKAQRAEIEATIEKQKMQVICTLAATHHLRVTSFSKCDY